MGIRKAIIRRVKRIIGGSGGSTPAKQPGLNVRWVATPSSSWIDALRFVPVTRQGNQKYALGFIDMRTRKGGRRYRYGNRKLISQDTYNRWLAGASKGKWWWRYVTRSYSPADPF